MSEEKDCPKPGEFSWNELVASDEAGQKKFYTGLFGWTAEAFGNGEKPYTLFKKGEFMVGGMMKSPKAWHPFALARLCECRRCGFRRHQGQKSRWQNHR